EYPGSVLSSIPPWSWHTRVTSLLLHTRCHVGDRENARNPAVRGSTWSRGRLFSLQALHLFHPLIRTLGLTLRLRFSACGPVLRHALGHRSPRRRRHPPPAAPSAAVRRGSTTREQIRKRPTNGRLFAAQLVQTCFRAEPRQAAK